MTTNASTPDGETPAGDRELAALVKRVRRPVSPVDTTADDATPEAAAEATEPGVDAIEPGVDAVPVLPLAPAVTDGEPPTRPRRRRSLAFRFGVAFVLGFLLAMGTGAGILYAWSQQYDARVLPGVRIGTTELGGLTREQAEAQIAGAYQSLGTGQITLTGPDGQVTTFSYADVGRGPDTSSLADAALAAGRQGAPSPTSSAHPRSRSTA